MTKHSIVIAGSLAQKPGRGGHSWVFLQYLLGFKKLGWDVLFLDRLEPEMCASEGQAPVPVERSRNGLYFADLMRRFGVEADCALFCGGTTAIGLGRKAVLTRVAASQALVNVMGFLRDEEILAAAPRRVFLDIDPGFGQMWQALGQSDLFRGHDAYVTIAANMGQPTCAIPTCGLDWITTRPPIVLDEWPDASGCARADAPITSVATWRGAYGPVEHAGSTYRLRAHEFRKFASLPRAAVGRFELALDIHPADRKDIDLLSANGWSLVEPRQVAGDPWSYRGYVQRSAAEFMVAKGMYVQTTSGWVSDRSVCYLASGRPVLAQDTGIGRVLPTGQGLLTFATVEEAAEATRAIARDRVWHARAARALAEEHFDSSRVLGALTRKLDLC